MPKLSGYQAEGSGKREGSRYGARTFRMIRRKRTRLAAKQNKRVSSHSDQAARGFA